MIGRMVYLNLVKAMLMAKIIKNRRPVLVLPAYIEVSPEKNRGSRMEKKKFSN